MVLRSALGQIPGAKVLTKDKNLGLWDFLIEYKGKKIALDVRSGPARKFIDNYDSSVKLMFSYEVDCLIFMFRGEVDEAVMKQFDRRSKELRKTVTVVQVLDDSSVQ